MPAAPLLSADEIAAALRGLPDWEHREDRLVKTFTRRDFRDAMGFLNRIARIADEQNHHPDVSIHWNRLTLSLWTHASGGVTWRDTALAQAVERLEERVEPE